MTTRRQYSRKRHRRPARNTNRKIWLIPVGILCALLICAGIVFFIWRFITGQAKPEDTVKQYFSLLSSQKYEEMYKLLTDESKSAVSEEDFVSRNQNIYEGISVSGITITFPEEPESSSGDTATVTYSTDMDTAAGNISFDNQMTLAKDSGSSYKVQWDSTLIFPSLQNEYKIKVATSPAQRGSIFDRNGNALATWGTVSEVGLVPGKMSGSKEDDIKKIAGLLGLTVDEINSALSASYVTDDTFVPLKQIDKEDTKTEEQLLKIPGILINDATARVYPLKEAAGQLTGYIQSITAEELEEKEDEGYHSGSVIGKTGLERAYENQLRAVDGTEINIVDEEGNVMETLASIEPQNGKDVYVTIDSALQKAAYEQFSSDPAAAAAMNPKTGEVLALVSSPGYDPNEFIMGMSGDRWEELSTSPDTPLSSRFQSAWVPGSTFKAVTAAIGIESGSIKPDENMGYVGLSWQKDESWGNYHVTTLTDYGENVNLENALVYSDNIYFARAALNIGADTLSKYFKAMGFDEEVPFEMSLATSTYDDDGTMDSDIQIADTGYGQGQLLVNPVHLLSMYSMFVNDGNMVQPTLVYQKEPEAKFWKEQVVSADTAALVKQDLIQVIENPSGTGAIARLDGVEMLGKTGTAEIKDSQDDTDGIERGWFICETTGETNTPLAFVGMIEDVKGKGGSNYVTKKVKDSISSYFE